MRLFTGLDLPDDVVEKLEELVRRLKPSAQVAWSPPSNWHITTKFIGEWKEERLGELTAALGTLPGRDPIPVAMRGLGFYPHARSAKILYCGVEGVGLESLARDTDSATTVCG